MTKNKKVEEFVNDLKKGNLELGQMSDDKIAFLKEIISLALDKENGNVVRKTLGEISDVRLQCMEKDEIVEREKFLEETLHIMKAFSTITFSDAEHKMAMTLLNYFADINSGINEKTRVTYEVPIFVCEAIQKSQVG